MRINKFSSTATVNEYILERDKSIAVFVGREADLHLSLLGATVGNYDRNDIADNSKEPFYIIHADVEAGGKQYEVCYIYDRDEDHIVGANFKATEINEEALNAFKDETLEYKQQVLESDKNEDSTFWAFAHRKNGEEYDFAGEAKIMGWEAEIFLKKTETRTLEGYESPIFIYDLFERIDEATDVKPWLDRLAALGRQVFIAVGESYPADKLKHPSVQIIKANNIN